MVTAMTLHRCLLIACVTLSQACDSKPAVPVAEKLPVAPLQIVVDANEPTDRMFEALLSTTSEQIVLVIGGTSYPVLYTTRATADGPGMVASLARNGTVDLWSTSGTEGTPQKPLLTTPLDEPGRNTIRAVLTDVVTRTSAKRIDVIVDRVQPASALAILLATVRPPFQEVRVVAGVPTSHARLEMKVVELGDETLKADILANKESLHDCFEQSLQRDPPVTGVVLTIEVDVGTNGKVPWVSVGGSYSRQLGDCVSAAMRRWTVNAKPARYTFQIQMKAA
jgi:hypothetical protein